MTTANTTMQHISNRLTRPALQSRVQLIALAGITILAAILRFYRLGEWSFWIDELRTLGHTQANFGSLETILQNTPPNGNWIPLSVISTSAALNTFGVSEWSARLTSAVIGIASIPILYYPIRRLLGTSIALVAVLLLAVSPWHVYWSQNARFYTALLLFYSLALFSFFHGMEHDRPQYLVLFIIFTYLATSERLLALFIIPVVVSYLLLITALQLEKPAGFRIRNLVLVILPMIIGGIEYSPWRFFGDLASLGRSIENPVAQGIFILFEIGIPLVALSFFCGLYLLLQRSRIGLFLLLGAVVPFGLVTLLTPFMFTEERYAFVTLTSWLVLGAVAVKELTDQSKDHGKLLAIGVLALLIADAAGENLMYFRVNNGNRRDYKGAFALVQEKKGEGDIIVSTWPELGGYYLDQEIVPWQDIKRTTIVESGKRVWFVIVPDMAWFWKNQDVYWWVSENCELIEVRYLRRPDDANLFTYLCDPTRNTALDKSR